MQKKWKIMIILLTILIILYALTSCKEKIQEKKGNEDNWKVYQQLEEKEEQKGRRQKRGILMSSICK